MFSFIGLIIAFISTLIKEFYNKSSNVIIKRIFWGLIILGFLIDLGSNIQTKKQNEDLNNNLYSLKLIADSTNRQNESLNNKIDSLQVTADSTQKLLLPFIKIAKKRYPDKNVHDALDSIRANLQYITKELEPAKIDTIIIEKRWDISKNLMEVILLFKTTNKNLEENIRFTVNIPGEEGRIVGLNHLGTALSNTPKIWADGKKASVEIHSLDNKVPPLKIILTKDVPFRIDSNYFNKKSNPLTAPIAIFR